MIIRSQVSAVDGLHREAWYGDCVQHGATCNTPEDMACSRYRYWLRIQLKEAVANAPAGHRCVFLMLNPSTASHLKHDPTVAKCCRFARRWGFTSVGVLNLFAYRATDPGELYTAKDPVGGQNDSILLARTRDVPMVVCAWGVHGALQRRGELVRQLLQAASRPLHYLALTKAGHPGHPLYLPGATQVTTWGM